MIRENGAPIRLLVVAALLATALLASVPATRAVAQTFTVTSTADPGDGDCATGGCTLREAIAAANANAGADTITFKIPGRGVRTIKPTDQLPTITEAVTIDGYSQPGASVNTREKGTNARLRIELSGAVAPVDAIGLVIAAGPTTVRGLVINRFRSGGLNGDGISIGNGSGNTDHVITGNFIGTDAAGRRDRGNEGRGIECFGACAEVRIGGPDPADRNLVSGNGSSGVLLFADANRVEGNLIGTDRTGRKRLGNDSNGIIVNSAVDNAIIENVIAFNGSAGVGINGVASLGNNALGNAIFKNGDGGIDLGGDGPSGNDLGAPPDLDTGPNGLQNFPIITVAKPKVIEGTVATTPLTTVRVDLFASPKGGDQGKRFVGFVLAATDADGSLDFTHMPKRPLKVGAAITATATTPVAGTSEFSAAAKVAKS